MQRHPFIKYLMIFFYLILMGITSFQCANNKKEAEHKLIVKIHPDEVRKKAYWRVDKGKWYKSGKTKSGLSSGKHTIEFKKVEGWVGPDNKIIVIKGSTDKTKEAVKKSNEKKGIIQQIKNKKINTDKIRKTVKNLPDRIENLKAKAGIKTKRGEKLLRQKKRNELLIIDAFYKKIKVEKVAPAGSKKEVKESKNIAGLNKLVITTTPPGAMVTLSGKEKGKYYRGATPFREYVLPDWYKMRIKKNNYQSVESDGLIDIKTREEVTIHKDLKVFEGVDNPLLMGEKAEKSKEWNTAISYYNQVPEDNREKYVSAQNRMGLIYLNYENDMEKSINAFKNAIKKKRNDYALHYNLAVAYYKTKNYKGALLSLDEVKKLKAMIPPDIFKEVESGVKFLRAQCHYALFSNEKDPQAKRNLGYRTIQIFEDFINQASPEIEQYKEKKKKALSSIRKIKNELQ